MTKAKNSQCTIYAFTDDEGYVRYVGQTRQTLSHRLRHHVQDAKKKPGPFSDWLLEKKRKLVALQENATWNISEIIWIERMRAAGHPLFNVLRGGNDTLAALRREGIIE